MAQRCSTPSTRTTTAGASPVSDVRTGTIDELLGAPEVPLKPDHAWPSDPAEHVWGPWHAKTGLPKPTRYRTCVHPLCSASETGKAPTAS